VDITAEENFRKDGAAVLVNSCKEIDRIKIKTKGSHVSAS
jgi:hypothetical protein